MLAVLLENSDAPIPHHTTVRLWIIRNGCYELERPISTRDDWIVIGDITIGIGKKKCLALLGIRKRDLEERKDYKLAHRDVQVVGLYPTEKSNNQFVLNSLEDVFSRFQGFLWGLIIDQGPDIKKGGMRFQENHPLLKLIYDIPHKLSSVVEKELKNDPEWLFFTKKLLETRRLVQQTELAAMMPATQRSQARFMDIGYLVRWPGRILESKEAGRLNSILDDRYEEYFGWIKDFIKPLLFWNYIVCVVDKIKSDLRKEGLSRDAYYRLAQFFKSFPSVEDERFKMFTENALRVVKEEAEKLQEGECVVCSTEVLESVFGKFKEINSRSQGITGIVLGIATFVGPARTETKVKEIMETCSVKAALTWIKENVGETVCKLKRKFFGRKRTKFDDIEVMPKAA